MNNRLHRRLLGAFVLTVTSVVSLLAGGVLLGTASADEPTPTAGTRPVTFSAIAAAKDGELPPHIANLDNCEVIEGTADAAGFAFSKAEPLELPEGSAPPRIFSFSPTNGEPGTVTVHAGGIPVEGFEVVPKEAAGSFSVRPVQESGQPAFGCVIHIVDDGDPTLFEGSEVELSPVLSPIDNES